MFSCLVDIDNGRWFILLYWLTMVFTHQFVIFHGKPSNDQRASPSATLWLSNIVMDWELCCPMSIPQWTWSSLSPGKQAERGKSSIVELFLIQQSISPCFIGFFPENKKSWISTNQILEAGQFHGKRSCSGLRILAFWYTYMSVRCIVDPNLVFSEDRMVDHWCFE